MSPESKKRIKKIKAGMFPFTVFFLLVVAGLSAVFFVMPGDDVIVRAENGYFSDNFNDNSLDAWWYDDSAHGTNETGQRIYLNDTGTTPMIASADAENISNCNITIRMISSDNDKTYFGFGDQQINAWNSQNDGMYVSMYDDGDFRIQTYDGGSQGYIYDEATYYSNDAYVTLHVNATNQTVTVFVDWVQVYVVPFEPGWDDLNTTDYYIITTDKDDDNTPEGTGIDDFVFKELDSGGSGGSGEICYYNLSGYDGSNRITFGSGQADEILWSNATGNWDAGAMLNIQVSTNATINVTDIFIDLNDTDLHTSVHWENISIDVAYSTTSFADANSSFSNDVYAIVDIDDGAGNVSLNGSWDTAWANPNPFPLSNDTMGADHFFCIRFKLELPSDATTGGPYTTDAWKVIWETTGE